MSEMKISKELKAIIDTRVAIKNPVPRDLLFSELEVEFLKKYHYKYSDNEIAKALQRMPSAIKRKRHRMGLHKHDPKLEVQRKVVSNKTVRSFADLTYDEKKHYLRSDIIKSARFKALKDALTSNELELYIEKYVEFMMDPTIETMTVMEKDALHQMILAEIRISQFLREEKNDRATSIEQGRIPISRSREIREAQEIMLKCQSSLNVERKQRVKNQTDQAITFTNVIKEMKDPNVRKSIGKEAAVLKFIAEKYYNDHLDDKIMSGNENKFELNTVIKDPTSVSGHAGEFLPTIGSVE